MNSVCGAVGGVAGKTGEAITDGIGAWIAKSMGEVAQSAADLATRAVDKTTAVDLNAEWFRHNYELILPIGLVLTVGTFCLQLTRAAWRRDERALAQAAFGTMIGVFFAFAAIACTTVALTVVDALSAGLFKAANSSVDDAIRRVIKVNELGAMYGLGWGVPAIIALGCAIGAFLYWAVMVARKVGILVLVTLAVFAGAGGGWEIAKRWRRGWIEATSTLIVSKLLMTIVFLLGVSAMGKSDSDGGMAALSDAMSGMVVMVLVLLCPYATYKFVHWAADGGGHDDLHRSGVAGVGTAAGAAKTAGQLAMQAKTGGMAPQGPSKIPGQGAGGVASGIDPSGGSGSGGQGRPKQTHFRFGEDPDAGGDKGRALIRRPPTDGDQGQPLVRRPGQESGARSSSGGQGSSDRSAGAMRQPSSAGGPPPSSGPPPQGGATPQRWVYPGPPGDSGS
ncbi:MULTISPECIES: ATP-binding protein [unclassified Streptomyces]|uniref:SCO6881 family protein n=1 Tax=Streptomyces sp. NBC_01187 TaxID=2903766 RepID=UPI002DDBD8F0|nr:MULTISPECIES: ATP-binding protein [unclassified Streptomyces]WSA97506.1 ATP-binding protein [Streptomyces sp. NBC_01795]WSB81934.1 ATP-binding protein [Streptomyces sp. NBC_01775]WSS17308.1 ATP-binding protein [Streptomyces sp. NBC_01186]WSS46049.1 ATP-binding protein [Streptomyces sp. NBC_01187]